MSQKNTTSFSNKHTYINPRENCNTLVKLVGESAVVFDSCFIRGRYSAHDLLSTDSLLQTEFVGLLGVNSARLPWYCTQGVMSECSQSFSSLKLPNRSYGYSLVKRTFENRLAVDQAFFETMRKHNRLLRDDCLNYNLLAMASVLNGFSELSTVDRSVLHAVISISDTTNTPVCLCTNDKALVTVARGYFNSFHKGPVYSKLRCFSNYFGPIIEWNSNVCGQTSSLKRAI
jgi:hypothetical protein